MSCVILALASLVVGSFLVTAGRPGPAVWFFAVALLLGMNANC